MNDKDMVFLTDYYEFSMAYTLFKEQRHEQIAYFDIFVRKIPDQAGYMVFNGLNQIIDSLSHYHFSEDHLTYLRSIGFDDDDFIDYLRNMKLDVDIWSVQDGTVVFANEPLVTVRGPILQAQLLETLLLLSINFPTLVTTKAARIVHAAKGRAVSEFGARRAHGFDASVWGGRAAVIAGCGSTSNTESGYLYGVPVSGTMAHSYVQMHENEYDAFLSYAKVHPNDTVLLVDTYNTLKSGIPNAIRVAQEYLIPNGYRLRGIRMDSGDLAYLSQRARELLDQAGLTDCKIIVSNALDENLIDDLLIQGAKIDAFGVGENLITSRSNPVLGGVYKLSAYEDAQEHIIPRIKISENIEKITNPGFKQFYRFYDQTSGKALADYIALHDEQVPEQQITIFDPVMPWKRKLLTNYTIRNMRCKIYEHGELIYREPDTNEIQAYCAQELSTLWEEVKRLVNPHKYYVDLSDRLYQLKLKLLEAHASGNSSN